VDHETIVSGLSKISIALKDMQVTLSRMGEKCDPHIYYHRCIIHPNPTLMSNHDFLL
jgi:hypothetical protein